MKESATALLESNLQPPTVETLQRELEELKRGLRECDLTKEEKLERYRAQMAANHVEQETPAAASIRLHIEQQKQAAQEWLTMCHVPPDADGQLRDLVLCMRGIDNHACNVFLRLALTIAGGKGKTESTYAQLVEAWPTLKPDVRTVLIDAVGAYLNKPDFSL